MKKMPFLLLSGAALALAACQPGGVPGLGSSSSHDENHSEAPASSSEESDSDLTYDADGNPVFENVELDFWSISIGSDGLIQQDIVDKFNEEYAGKIHVNRAEARRVFLGHREHRHQRPG